MALDQEKSHPKVALSCQDLSSFGGGGGSGLAALSAPRLAAIRSSKRSLRAGDSGLRR